MRNRQDRVREYGEDFVAAWEQEWADRGYRINWNTGLLVKIDK